MPATCLSSLGLFLSCLSLSMLSMSAGIMCLYMRASPSWPLAFRCSLMCCVSLGAWPSPFSFLLRHPGLPDAGVGQLRLLPPLAACCREDPRRAVSAALPVPGELGQGWGGGRAG